MAQQTFDIEITKDSVTVRLDVSSQSPRERFYWCSAYFLLLVCGMLFLPGKNGNPSARHDLSSYPIDSGRFQVVAVILAGFILIMCFISRGYLKAAYPSDEQLHCDGYTLTVSKVRWLDFSNSDWKTRSYDLREVKNIAYGGIAWMQSGKVNGLSFIAHGREHRILPGLDQADARKVLAGLKTLGVDVMPDGGR